ncbi:MAG: hypothetical protein ABTD50_04180 [Polyangiaceae bacterium]|jgi:hypothetical protein
MGGRYADELRRITREQGGTPDSDEPPSREGDGRHGSRRRAASLFVALVVVSLAGGGWLLVRQMLADAKLQDCVMAGHKNCAPLEINSAAR